MKVYNHQMSQLLGYHVFDDVPDPHTGFSTSTPAEFRRSIIIVAVGFSIMGIGALIKIFFFG